MKKTLLLCFIHGFKGGEDTFGDKYQFTEDLRQHLARELPKVDVRVEVYPKFETRGDLKECVGRFRDWLQEKVIDLEVAAQTPSPTVDPSVRTILIGHSMGGIVAAETVIALTSDKPITSPPTTRNSSSLDASNRSNSTTPATTTSPVPDAEIPSPTNAFSSLMFPYIQGVLAFDTPFLGIAPGVVAHGAEGHYSKASAAITQLSGLTGAIWGGGGKAAQEDVKAAANRNRQALPAPPDAKKQQGGGGGGGDSAWGNWGKIAMYAGAGAALAAGGAAAYLKRNEITEGLGWATSHLEFVGCLARGEELRRRVGYMARAERELGIGFGNLYTRLGAAASTKQSSVVGTILPGQRTFCNLPKTPQGGGAGDWRAAINDRAEDETVAHMTMFEPRNNPGYEKLLGEAQRMVASWMKKKEWYEESSRDEV